MTRPSEQAAIDAQHTAMAETLRVAVPLWIFELRGLSDDHLRDIATQAATTIGEKGDVLQFGSTRRGEVAGVFNALARGLAAAALLAQGGIDYAGLHWCRIPHCRATRRYDHEADPWVPAEPEQRRRPVVDLPDLGTWPPPPA